MYRPTVRYADVYKTYVDDLFRTTSLDRNQIIRAALFTAAHSVEFLALMNKNKKRDVPLPSPSWRPEDHHLWRDRNGEIKKEEGDVRIVNDRGTGKIESNRFAARESDVRNENGRQRKEQGRIRKIRTGGGGIRAIIG